MAMAHETSARVAQKRELKGEAILDAATAVLEAEGLDGLTLGRVASALQLVPGALYRYYDSKDALLAGLQRRAVGQIGIVLQQAVAKVPATRSEDVAWLARLLTLARAYASLPKSAPQAWHLVSLMLAEPKPLLSASEAARTAPMLSALLETVLSGLDRAAALKTLAKGDPAQRTLAFWGAVHGAAALTKLRLWVQELPEPADVAVQAAAALLVGWGAKPKVVQQARRLAAKGAPS